MLKNFNDIYLLTLNRIDEETGDSQIESILKEAINKCYMMDLTRNDRRFVKDTFTSEDGMIFLPEDLDTIERITPALAEGEYRKGNVVFVSGSSYTIVYTTVPQPLVNDTDIPDVSSKFFYCMSTYACYAYYMYKKKVELANMFLSEYLTDKEKPHDDQIPEGTAYYYEYTGGDE